MEDDRLAAYHADQRAKGAGAAVQKQGLGFSASPGCATLPGLSTLPARCPLPNLLFWGCIASAVSYSVGRCPTMHTPIPSFMRRAIAPMPRPAPSPAGPRGPHPHANGPPPPAGMLPRPPYHPGQPMSGLPPPNMGFRAPPAGPAGFRPPPAGPFPGQPQRPGVYNPPPSAYGYGAPPAAYGAQPPLYGGPPPRVRSRRDVRVESLLHAMEPCVQSSCYRALCRCVPMC